MGVRHLSFGPHPIDLNISSNKPVHPGKKHSILYKIIFHIFHKYF